MTDRHLFHPSTQKKKLNLNTGEIKAVIYHNLFDYPLNIGEIVKWQAGSKVNMNMENVDVSFFKGNYFISGKKALIYKKILRNRISQRKIILAKRVCKILSLIPTIQMVALTGSVAMNNAEESGDVDFLIVTKKNSLWTTRAIVLFLLWVFQKPFRRFGDTNQKDKICLNMWLDTSSMTWDLKRRNSYTSHEIAQIIPLVNKDMTYQLFLQTNKWILDFWPNSIRIKKEKIVKKEKTILNPIENLLYYIQYKYMKNKISNETVSKTKALFHPQDWSRVISNRLST